jgi:hypothetical protein
MSDFATAFAGTHALAADLDASGDALRRAETHAALVCGTLLGRLAHLPETVATLFAYRLTRLCLTSALAQSGFALTATEFDHWFCGLGRGPAESAATPYTAFAIAEAVLAEVSQSPWELLANAAVRLRGLTRFERGGGDREAPSPLDALTQAHALVGSVHATADNEDPFAPFAALHRAAASSLLFAPIERENCPLSALPAAFPRSAPLAPKTPLWALDLTAGLLLADIAPGTPPLPLAGLVREEALAAQWLPRERAILIANALGACCAALTQLIETAYAHSRALAPRLSGFRSTSHAPALALVLSGFGPLRPVQIECGFGLTRNGTHKLLKALTEAGLVESERIRGQILVRARRDAPVAARTEVGEDRLPALSRTAVDEFEAAMANAVKLLGTSDEGDR